jgi:hypothetical protein
LPRTIRSPGGSTAPTNITFKSIVVFSPAGAAGQWDYEDVTAQNGGRDNRSSYQAVFSDTSISLSRTCPNTVDLGTSGYTASGDTLQLFDTVLVTVETYTRQP